MMSTVALEIVRNLSCGWLAGLLIGLERTYNGRAAGFRTHALVGLAAAGTVMMALQPVLGSPGFPQGGQPLNAGPLGQGVITGIGFLGAGVIFKEGVSVQGLTTAASIWATAAAGLLFGVGMIPAGVALTTLALVTLVLFRWVEDAIPWRVYAVAVLRFEADRAPSETELRALLGEHAVSLRDVSYKLIQEGRIFEFAANVHTGRNDAFARLSKRLKTIPGLVEYEVSRISK